MVYKIEHDWGAGFGWIMGVIILVVIIYTVVRLRKQVSKREASEEKKTRNFEQHPTQKDVREDKNSSERKNSD